METWQEAACYIRVSTEDQTEYSPEAQRRALEHYARQHQLTISPEHVYIDAGISGRRAETRPAFMAMIAAAKKRPPPFSVILVHKFDRFARNREDSIVYKSMLRRQCGVQVVSITEHLEDDKMSLILEAMLEAMAEYYSINLGDEVRKGMREKARRGELQTAPPFGYGVKDNILQPVPREAFVVQEIYRRFLAGEAMVSIARWTQQMGMLTHRGNPLDSRSIRYILSNPVYVGKLRWHGEGEQEGGSMLVQGKHTPLIEESVFQAAGIRLDAQVARSSKHARPWGERKHWLAGLARCGACGSGLVFSKPHYLKCGRYTKGKCSVSQHIVAETLEAAVLSRMRLDAAGKTRFSVQPVVSDTQRQQEALRMELAALEKKLQRLRDAFLCGAEGIQEYKREKERLTAQANHLRQELLSSSREVCAASEQHDEVQKIVTTLEDPTSGTEEKYRAAHHVLESCIWNKEEGVVRLVYRLRL